MTTYAGHDWQVGETIDEAHLQALDDAARDAIPRAEVAATYVPTPAITAPAAPEVGQSWLSESLLDLRFAPAAGDRYPVLSATQAWEQNSVQEPLVWFYGSKWHMLYMGGWTSTYLGYATCTGDPLVPANWTKPLTGPIYGRDAGTGFTGTVGHCGLYIEGTTLYLYYQDYNDPAGLKVATASITADPPVFTPAGLVLANSGMTANVFVVKDTTQTHPYTLFYETQAAGWQTGVATGDSPTGTFTSVRAITTSLQPFTGAGASNPWIELEGSSYVCYFHASPASVSLPSQIYRATIPRAALTTDGWTLDNQSRPIIRRAHRWEVDQVADIMLTPGSAGPRVAFWSAVDNTAPTGAIMATPALPLHRAWNGTSWVRQDGTDATPPITAPQKALTAVLTTDFSVDSGPTAFSDVVTVDFIPSGTAILADFAGFGSNSGQYLDSIFRLKCGSQVAPVGKYTQASAGAQFPFAAKAVFTGLTPGVKVTVQFQAAADGTFSIRSASAPSNEGAALTVQDAAVLPSWN